jgi:hypothetical protein
VRSRFIISAVLVLVACKRAPFAEGTSVDALRFTEGALVPSGALRPDRPDVDSLLMRWYSHDLSAMREQRLVPAGHDPVESYRFTWLRSFDPPIAVRISATARDTFAVVSQTSGSAYFTPPHLLRHDSIRVTAPEWASVRAALARAAFWTANPEPAALGGTDGAQWVLEGLRESRYHIVDRWSPRDTGSAAAFRHAGIVMLGVARLVVDSGRIY